MAETEIKKIAIVLSGGVSRGAAHIALVNEIIKKVGRERICVVSGSSIGAINAYAVGVGHEENLIEAYRNIDCDSTRHFIKTIKAGLFNDTFNLIEDDITIPTYVTATRIAGFDCGYFCLNHMPRKDLKTCINASMGFPILNGPIRFNGHFYLDGGATDNVPVWPVTYFDPDVVIILHCYSRYFPPEYLFEKLRKDCIVIDIDVTLHFPEGFRPFNFAKTDFEMMTDCGKADGKEFAEKVFSDFYTDNVRQRCYQYISDKMEERRKKSFNGYMELVEMLNALYYIKEGRF